MNEEFNEWLASAYPPTRPLNGAEAFWIKAAWLEATRRADRNARLECAEICRDIYRNYECSHIGADLCEQSIRATIPEDQP